MAELEKTGHANEPVKQEANGRERIVGHQFGPIFFAGRYNTACGGCDTMSWKGAADYICDLLKWKSQHGPVFAEGLMLAGWGTGRLRSLWEECEQKLHVIQLTTSLEECLASVQARREERARAAGKETKPLNPDNTVAKWHGTMRGSELLQKSGVPVEFLDREAAFLRARELLQ